MKNNAKIFSIEEFSTFDGPGVRMTVFFKGCPLKCDWCHNPEGQSFNEEYIKNTSACTGCGSCIKFAKNVDGKTILTSESLKACKNNFIRKSGTDYTAIQLANYINNNADVLKSCGGGVTFSGGEPLCFIDYIISVKELLNGVHVAIQTSGYASYANFLKAIKNCDYFLYDLKIINSDKFKKHCGQDNAVILKNYKTLASSGVDFVTRVPLIPTVTDTDENIADIAVFLVENNVKYVELLPYNEFAPSKYLGLLRKDIPTYDKNDCNSIDKIIQNFKNYGIKAVKI